MNVLGISGSLLLARWTVTDVSELPDNNSTSSVNSTSTPIEDKEELKDELNTLMWITSLLCLINTLLVFIYFPNKPKHPPSRTSGLERLDFMQGLKGILKHKKAWIIGTVMAVPLSINSKTLPDIPELLKLISFSVNWQSMMVAFLSEICDKNGECLTQTWLIEVAIVTNVVSSVFTVGLAMLADVFRGHFKSMILILLSLGTITFLLLSLVLLDVIKFEEFKNVTKSCHISDNYLNNIFSVQDCYLCVLGIGSNVCGSDITTIR